MRLRSFWAIGSEFADLKISRLENYERKMIRTTHVKGLYASCKGPGVDGISHLIYPCAYIAAKQGTDEKKGEAGAGF